MSSSHQAARAFVSSMLVPAPDPDLVKKVTAAISHAPADIVESVAESGGSSGTSLRQGLDEFKVPKIVINSAWRPTDMCAVRGYDVETELKLGVGTWRSQ